MTDDHEPLPPLGALARRALAAEQSRADVDAAMQDRVLTRVVASVAVGAAVSVAAGTASAAAAKVGGGGAAATAGVTAKTLPWILGAFLVGGGAGAAIHAAVVPAPAPAITAGPSAAPPALPEAIVPTPTAATSSLPAISVTSLPSVAAPRMSTTPSADVDLAPERALVDRARAALGRGQSSDALDALDAHAARFPRGRLSEEREALAVDALARAGRADSARARATAFHAKYPNSVFGAVVDSAVPPR
jgi:hypothetical protein